MGVWGTLCWLTAEWCGTTGGNSTATQAGGGFERNHFPAITAYLPCRVPTDGPAPRGSCRQVAWLGLGCCVRFGTCCSPARERNPRFSPAVVPEGNRRDTCSSALATTAGWPCVLGGHSWGCVSVPLCGAAASGLEGARVGPGWQRGRGAGGAGGAARRPHAHRLNWGCAAGLEERGTAAILTACGGSRPAKSLTSIKYRMCGLLTCYC